MLRYQADKALFDQLQAKYRQMHNTIESSGALLSPVPCKHCLCEVYLLHIAFERQ